MWFSRRLRKVVVALTLALVLGGGSVAKGWQGESGPGADAPRVEANESFLRWGARASGPIGLVILALSIYLVALVVWMAFEYRRSVALPDPLIREVTDLVEQKQFTEAYGRLAANDSFLARVLAAGVRKLPSGLPAAQRAMEMTNDDVTMEMEHRTTYLATVGTLGPMIGLVGTVYGMILSFRVIATAGASPQASQLAAGISTALFATLEGIALAVPAIAFYALFRNRISRLSLEVSLASETLLDGFAQGVRMPHPLAAAAASPSRPALPPSAKSD
jgi:biopolymer transport protein ExbB